MESPIEVTEGVDGWNTIIFLYNSALKEVGTKLEISSPFRIISRISVADNGNKGASTSVMLVNPSTEVIMPERG